VVSIIHRLVGGDHDPFGPQQPFNDDAVLAALGIYETLNYEACQNGMPLLKIWRGQTQKEKIIIEIITKKIDRRF